MLLDAGVYGPRRCWRSRATAELLHVVGEGATVGLAGLGEDSDRATYWSPTYSLIGKGMMVPSH